jgi:hypothetical protein
MKSRALLVLAAAVAMATLIGAADATAALLLHEDFSGSSASDLNGTSTEVGGQTWTASTLWKADGSKSTNGRGHAFVPFTPAAGAVYTLSVIVNPDVSTSSDWLSLGFTASNNTGNAFHDSPNNAAPWILNREDDASTSVFQTFLGPSTGGGANHNPNPDLVGEVKLGIVLDTTAANWTAEWFGGGTSLRGPVVYGTNPTINYVGIGAYNSATGYVREFRLSDATVIPEPSTLLIWSLLVGLGVGLRWRGRGRTK